jgi:hypothetical protein
MLMKTEEEGRMMDDVTGRIQKELERIGDKMREQRKALAPDGDDTGLARSYYELYAAQQALAWALEPEAAKAPYDTIVVGIREDSADCRGGGDVEEDISF